MRVRVLALVLVLVAVGVWLLVRPGDRPAVEREEPVDFAVAPPEDAARGAPVLVPRPAPPPLVRWRGSLEFDQRGSGSFGGERTVPNRRYRGTVSATETTTGPADARATTIDAALELVTPEASGGARRAASVRLTLVRDPAGRVAPRATKLDAPGDLFADLEVFQFAWTQHFAPPDRPVRVGERLPIDTCVDLEYVFQRPLLFLFQKRATLTGPVWAPIEGGVWVESVDRAGDGTLRLRTRSPTPMRASTAIRRRAT